MYAQDHATLHEMWPRGSIYDKTVKKVKNILGLIPQNFNIKEIHANYEINADAGFLYSNSYRV